MTKFRRELRHLAAIQRWFNTAGGAYYWSLGSVLCLDSKGMPQFCHHRMCKGRYVVRDIDYGSGFIGVSRCAPTW